MKPLLSNYKLIFGYVIGGFVITATVIVGYLVWNSFFNKPKPTPQPQTQVAPTQTNPLAQFDGSYTGTTPDHAGITSVTMSIANGQISGNATYVEAGLTITLTVSGTVAANGAVTGNLLGSGSSEGENFTVNGTYTGKITGNTLTFSYTGSGGGGSANGTIVLTKK